MKKLVIPRIRETVRYINSELDEREREEMFRLKRFKESKDRAKIHAIKSKKSDLFLSRTASSFLHVPGDSDESSYETLSEEQIVEPYGLDEIEKGLCSICTNMLEDSLAVKPCEFCQMRLRGEIDDLCPICAYPDELMNALRCSDCHALQEKSATDTCIVCSRKQWTGEVCGACDNLPPTFVYVPIQPPIPPPPPVSPIPLSLPEPPPSPPKPPSPPPIGLYYQPPPVDISPSPVPIPYVNKEVSDQNVCSCKLEADEVFKHDINEFGTFETKFEEIVRVTRQLNDDGTIAHEKKVTRVKTERKNMPEENLHDQIDEKKQTKVEASTFTPCKSTVTPAPSIEKDKTDNNNHNNKTYQYVNTCPRCQTINKLKETKHVSTCCSLESDTVTLNVNPELNMATTSVEPMCRDATTTAKCQVDSDFIFKIELDSTNVDTQTTDSYITVRFIPNTEEKHDVGTKTSWAPKKKCQFCDVDKKGAKRAQSSSVCDKNNKKYTARQTKSCPERRCNVFRDQTGNTHICSKVKALDQRINDVLSDHSNTTKISDKSFHTKESKHTPCDTLDCPANTSKASSNVSEKKTKKTNVQSGSSESNDTIISESDFAQLKESTMKIFDLDVEKKSERSNKKVSEHDKTINIVLLNDTKFCSSCPFLLCETHTCLNNIPDGQKVENKISNITKDFATSSVHLQKINSGSMNVNIDIGQTNEINYVASDDVSSGNDALREDIQTIGDDVISSENTYNNDQLFSETKAEDSKKDN